MVDTILQLQEKKAIYNVQTDEEKDKEKEALRKVAEEKAEIRKKNVDNFVKEFHKYPKGQIFRMLQIEGNFVVLEKKNLKAIAKISGPLALLLYLKLAVNREMGYTFDGEEKEVFCNLDKYYMEGGFLCTLRTQGYVAKQLGTNQQNVFNWFRKLEKLGLIKKIGTEKLITKNEEYLGTVYALGELVNIDGFDEEVFYYEVTK